MVTRKPVPSAEGSNLAPFTPPYPITPLTTAPPAPFRVEDVKGQLRSPDSDTDSINAWGGDRPDNQNAEQSQSSFPESLRVGPQGFTPSSSQERLRVAGETNPFLKKSNTGSTAEKESSADAWGDRSSTPSTTTQTPSIPPGTISLPKSASLSNT
jgi:hypothetical protein